MTEVEPRQIPIKPILVVLVWRGGDRFRRALESLSASEHYFSRIILSITSQADSADVQLANEYLATRASSETPSKAEVICTGKELPTMQHQKFWVEYLLRTGASLDSWIYWLAYDDEVLGSGIASLIDKHGNWPLETGVCYLGPWVVRHEASQQLWYPSEDRVDECWTAFEPHQQAPVSAIEWVGQQLMQPTYIQMSGSVATLRAHKALVHNRPKKSGPMRIEMATAIASDQLLVSQFTTPISRVYGRSDSDRSNYGRAAYKEDVHLLLLMLKQVKGRPRDFRRLVWLLTSVTRHRVMRLGRPVAEEWRVMAEE